MAISYSVLYTRLSTKVYYMQNYKLANTMKKKQL